MKLLKQIQQCLIAGATLGLLMPQVTFAGERSRTPPIRDVALQQGGMLQGAVLSAKAQGAAGQTISLAVKGQKVANVISGPDGKFVIHGLQPGIYTVTVGESQSVARLWSQVAAPPAATTELLLVDQQPDVVRGQNGDFHLPQWDHPFLVGGLLGAAGVIGGVIGYNVKDFDPAS